MVVVGVTAVLVAVLANPLGIGHAGFGWKKLLLSAIGVAVAVAGALRLRAASRRRGNFAGIRYALRTKRYLWPFAVVLLAYVALRLHAFLALYPDWHRAPDTYSYESCAGRSFWDPSLYLCGRAWTLPVYYKIVTSDTLRIVGQFIFSLAAWSYLAATAARAESSSGRPRRGTAETRRRLRARSRRWS